MATCFYYLLNSRFLGGDAAVKSKTPISEATRACYVVPTYRKISKLTTTRSLVTRVNLGQLWEVSPPKKLRCFSLFHLELPSLPLKLGSPASAGMLRLRCDCVLHPSPLGDTEMNLESSGASSVASTMAFKGKVSGS